VTESSIDLISQFTSSLVTEKVGIIEFAESDEYCGKPLYPRQRTLLKILFNEELDGYDEDVLNQWIKGDNDVSIAPGIRKRIEYVRSNKHPHFRLVQFVGGRRSSKGHLTGLAVAYKVYTSTLIEDPLSFFRVPKGKKIHFSILAGKLEQAKETQYSDAYDWIVECKPLKDRKLINKGLAESITVYTPTDLRRIQSLRNSGMRMDKDMASLKVQAFGANPGTLRGIASLVAVFDEYAHILSGEYKQADAALWQALTPSLRQFRQNAMIFTNSSPYNKQGQFYKLYEEALKMDGDEPANMNHFMMQFPSWELYRDWEKDRHFYSVGPVVLPPEEDPEFAQEERNDPEGFKVEYRAQFAEVEHPFLNPDMVDRAFDTTWHYKMLGRPLEPTRGAMGFMRYKGHGDPATVSANFGIAIGHVEEIDNPDTGNKESHVVFDVVNAFFPDDFENNTIDYLQVTPTIVDLINAFRPFEFTFDQYESTYLIQSISKEIAKNGIPVNVYETTATKALNMQRANSFKTALNLGRVHVPHPTSYKGAGANNPIELAQFELKFLREVNGRVDKQTFGPVKTKDIADCLMAVTDTLIGDTLWDAPSFDMALGAPGGFSIGGETPAELTGWYPNDKMHNQIRQSKFRMPRMFGR
jgi:hypothetical protein